MANLSKKGKKKNRKLDFLLKGLGVAIVLFSVTSILMYQAHMVRVKATMNKSPTAYRDDEMLADEIVNFSYHQTSHFREDLKSDTMGKSETSNRSSHLHSSKSVLPRADVKSEVDFKSIARNSQMSGISSISFHSSYVESESSDDVRDDNEGDGAIVPFDLSVNFLKLISRAPGAPPEPPMAISASKIRSFEDFLPVVVPSDVEFRWRHRAKNGAFHEDFSLLTGYRLVVRLFESNRDGSIVWDSGRINVNEKAGVRVGAVAWGGSSPPKAGQILEWQVSLFDFNDKESSSKWSKFAVGPEDEDDWHGEWIAHPSDMEMFDRSTERWKINADKKKIMSDRCKGWKLRRPLPVFRRNISYEEFQKSPGDHVSSALLFVSGLGSFRASVNGVPLSTSGPIDPPFTDYSKRVSYRGYDITPFLSEGTSVVLGITMGSGWWDHRPVTHMAKPELLPNGPVTIIAQVMITYTSGKTSVIGYTGKDGMNEWQVARGHIRESDLFTGEIVDLDVLDFMEGWDTPRGWSGPSTINTDNIDPYAEINKWVEPVAYRTDVTQEERKQKMALKAKALRNEEAKSFPIAINYADPIGKLVPSEIPPIMSMERIPANEIHHLGNGRWLLDYGKTISGMIHFDEGLPIPIVPKKYPRAHGFKAATEIGDTFITVIYGESLEMSTGDINRVLVAGLGLHDGGPRHKSKREGATNQTYCFPDDHDAILSQRDVYVTPKKTTKETQLYGKARQSHFTTHSFRFAEVCCTAEPPKNTHALMYRTALSDWGTFDSSNVILNGGYELVRNSLNSNMLSVQSDCPHREKLSYGGDLVASSPSAFHMFDMGAFYKKSIRDWMEAQWDNGAYTETTVWQNLNDYAGIGYGAGETVWASAPPILTVRHYQNYGDVRLLHKSLSQHVKWLDFLEKYFDDGMQKKGYDEELKNYYPPKSGLGDWLAMRSRDTFLTHTAFFMATGRSIAYIAHVVGRKDLVEKGMSAARKLKDRISYLYLKNGKDNFDLPRGDAKNTPGPEMSLYSKIVPGEKRCIVLKNWFQRTGYAWGGNEEMNFINEMPEDEKDAWIKSGELMLNKGKWTMGWSQWEGLNEGLLSIRYSLKTLSEMGFHNIALRKASGFGMGSTEYMLRHNGTTMWESWWRSEDLYSRNHPMLGALAEWMSSCVAGVSLSPTTTGGRTILFWPRFPNSATELKYASAEQGSSRGDYAIAWRFEDLPDDESKYDSSVVMIRIRFLVPPSGEATFRLPIPPSTLSLATIKYAMIMPDLRHARSTAKIECDARRSRGLGFPYNWDYDSKKMAWFKRLNGKAIGTPCESFLFDHSLDNVKWSTPNSITRALLERTDTHISPGFYEILISNWILQKEVKPNGRIGNIPEYYKSNSELGPYCSDINDHEWHITDATHMI